MRGGLVVLVALGLCVPVASAAKGDPQKKLTKSGQAHAIAASLHRADFPPTGWTQQPKQPNQKSESNPRCSYYNPDQSDLVEIGSYDSPDFDQADRKTPARRRRRSFPRGRSSSRASATSPSRTASSSR